MHTGEDTDSWTHGRTATRTQQPTIRGCRDTRIQLERVQRDQRDQRDVLERVHRGVLKAAVLLVVWIVPIAAGNEVVPVLTSQPLSQTVSHHAPVSLNCSAQPQSAIIRWLYEGKPLDKRRHKGLKIVGSNLNFPRYSHSASRHQNDGEYRCTATTSAGTVISMAAILDKPHLGKFTNSSVVSVTVPEGGYVTLTCDPPKSSPPAKVVFQGPDGSLVDTSRDWVHVLPSGNVVLGNLTSAASGHFRCVAVNPVSGANVTSGDVMSLVVDPSLRAPRFGTHLLASSSRRQAMPGDDVTLECPTYGHGVARVSWEKYGGQLPTGRFQTTDFGNLVISKVQYQDTGTYTCNVSSQTVQVSLEVLSLPKVKVLTPLGEVKAGVSVEMACEVEGSPQPRVLWFRDGEKLNETVVRQGGAKLVLDSVSTSDAGVYQCWATNSAGSAQGTLYLQVTHPVSLGKDKSNTADKKKKSGRIDKKKTGRRKMRDRRKNKNGLSVGKKEKPKYAPSVPTVTQLSDRSVMLNWSVMDKGGGQTIEFFKIQFKEMSPKKGPWQTKDPQIPHNIRVFEVNGLKSGGSYKFRILAVYEDSDNKNSANTPLFKLNQHTPSELLAPDMPPTIVKATPILHQDNFGMGITWQYKAESAPPIEGFVILYKPFNEETDHVITLPSAGTRNHVIVDLLPKTFYNIRMQTFNTAGRSPQSNQVVESTKPGTPGRLHYDDTDFNTLPYPYEDSTPPSSGRDRRSKSNNTLEQPVILGIVLGALLLILVVLVFMCWWKHQQQKRQNLNNNPQKFQDQSQCVYTDASTHTKPNGGLYPPINGGPPHMANGHGPPQDGGHRAHGRMNIDVNPLAEYDMQTKVHGDRRGPQPQQFYGNGVNGKPQRYAINHSNENIAAACHGGQNHTCNGGDVTYCEQGYPMKHRTLPTAPSQPLTAFYTDSTTNSLGRPTLNHEYSEPGDREMLSQQPPGIPHPAGIHPPYKNNLPHAGVPNHVKTCDYEWASGAPRSEPAPQRLSPEYPEYHTANDFVNTNPPPAYPGQQRLPTSVSSGSSRGQVSFKGIGSRGVAVECHGGGKKRRRKRPPSRDLARREFAMRDQATNTDLSSNEGTFEFTTYAKSGSSSGSDVGGVNGCDSNYGNNGSLESIEDSASAASGEEFEPLRVVHRPVPL